MEVIHMFSQRIQSILGLIPGIEKKLAEVTQSLTGLQLSLFVWL